MHMHYGLLRHAACTEEQFYSDCRNYARTSLSNCFLSAPLPLSLAAGDVDEAKDLQIVGQLCDIGRGVVQKHGKPAG